MDGEQVTNLGYIPKTLTSRRSRPDERLPSYAL